MYIFDHLYDRILQIRSEYHLSSELFLLWIVRETMMFLHMFLLQLVLFHLGIIRLILLVYHILVFQCTFFIWYSGSMLFPNTIFDFLHLIPCFNKIFRISEWLILSTSFIFFIINPANKRNDHHVENGSP